MYNKFVSVLYICTDNKLVSVLCICNCACLYEYNVT